MKRVPNTERDADPSVSTYAVNPLRFHSGRSFLWTFAVFLLAGCGAEPVEAPPQTPLPVGVGSAMPHLIPSGDGALLSWLEPVDPTDREGAWRVAYARYDGSAWSEAATVTEREGMFINWADFPSVIEAGGALHAHWLQRGPTGGYDYNVEMASGSAGEWSEPFVVHEDRAPVEHGFVSTVELPDGGVGVMWLDGRDFVNEEPHEMQVRYRSISASGERSAETLLDVRACDCCQTDLAVAGTDLVAVYRDRSEGEIRDISVVRFDGSDWSDPVRVHDDGWEIAGCPVNGPAIAADGERVVVAWFTAAQNDPRVNVAFSSDAGRTFGPPQRVDVGAAIGRVDVVLASTQSGPSAAAIVSWVERGAVEGGARLMLRAIDVGEEEPTSPAVILAETTSARSSGFPQMVRVADDVLVAWTDTAEDRLRSQRVPFARIEAGTAQ